MTLTIDLTPEQEARLNAAAARAGLDPAALVKRLVDAHLPGVRPEDRVRAQLRRWQAEDRTLTLPEGEEPRSIADLFREWDTEDAALTDAEREAEDRLWADFEQGINDARAALGMRRLSS